MSKAKAKTSIKPQSDRQPGAASPGASTTLTVTVFGGRAPEPIDITLFKESEVVSNFQKPESFSQKFNDLQQGFVYTLFIAGKNPLTADGATKCEISTDQISLHPPDDTPALKKGKQYLVEFNFTV